MTAIIRRKQRDFTIGKVFKNFFQKILVKLHIQVYDTSKKEVHLQFDPYNTITDPMNGIITFHNGKELSDALMLITTTYSKDTDIHITIPVYTGHESYREVVDISMERASYHVHFAHPNL